ncbi:MAG: NAD(P)/FAD-dependent oxidoreductase [Candidatus Glassbacteria bacterium]|nr:NAD(P)/FAD-dependent oxidoreductase [Candidatus Glassbacteria bacterium]
MTGKADRLKVLIAGGGPGGCSCALSLARLGAQLGRELDVVLFEHKHFGIHYNQCMGVLSPPIETIMRDCLGISLPGELIQRQIEGYWLHSENSSIRLTDNSSPKPGHSVATRRVLLDRFLFTQVREAGVEVYGNRVSDIEFSDGGVRVYTEGGSFKGDILVGAFGLDRQLADILQRRTGYRAPDFLETVITKIHPGQRHVDNFGNDIHAFLLSDPAIEFAALTPKGNHITALVAGRHVTSDTLRAFLASDVCSSLVDFPYNIEDIFKGSFPICPARKFYGDNYITVGDSAGLVRPFKGKGINTALLSGWYAARSILERGVSRQALSQVELDFAEQIGDLWYGRAARLMTGVMTRFSLLDPVIEVARTSPALSQALFDSVSAQDTYRNIIGRITGSPATVAALGLETVRWFLNSRSRKKT